MTALLHRQSLLQSQLDELDEVIARLQTLISECPARKCRATDRNTSQGEPHAL